MVMVIDVLERDDLAFPRSLPEFQRLFPDEAELVRKQATRKLKKSLPGI